MKFDKTKSYRAFSVTTMALAGALLMLPVEQIFAGHAGVGGNSPDAHLRKNCETQATEQNLQGDARGTFLTACRAHEAAESSQDPMQSQVVPTSGSTDAPLTQTQSK